MTDSTTAAPTADTTQAIPTDPAAIAARDAELTALFENDPGAYHYSDGGKLANEHLEIRKAQQAAEQAEGADADADDIDLDTEAGHAEATEADEPGEVETEETEPHSPWPERPEDLDASDEKAVAEWKEKAGLAARDEYELPELEEGQHYTDYGQALAEKVTALAYDLDISPDQAQQLVLKGDGILKALAESRDAEDNRAGSKVLIEEFGGDRNAVKAHVTRARATLREVLPDGLGDLLLQSRGPDGRRLAFQPEFLRWASQLSATPAATQPREDRRVTIQRELDDLTALMHKDIDEFRRPWRATGISGSERHLELMRELASDAPAKPSAADVRAEERRLVKLSQDDPALFQFGSWPGARSPADRLHAIRMGRA